MKYEFSKTYDQQKAREYLTKLIKDESKCNITKVHPKRSISANNYLHVLLSIWANHHGYTIDETKDIVKDALGYTYEADKGKLFNEIIPFNRVSVHRSKTSEMDSAELATFTDKFRTWSQATCNYYLCSPAEYLLEQIYFDNLANEKEL